VNNVDFLMMLEFKKWKKKRTKWKWKLLELNRPLTLQQHSTSIKFPKNPFILKYHILCMPEENCNPLYTFPVPEFLKQKIVLIYDHPFL
jgi:hypothetical protein